MECFVENHTKTSQIASGNQRKIKFTLSPFNSTHPNHEAFSEHSTTAVGTESGTEDNNDNDNNNKNK